MSRIEENTARFIGAVDAMDQWDAIASLADQVAWHRVSIRRSFGRRHHGGQTMRSIQRMDARRHCAAARKAMRELIALAD